MAALAFRRRRRGYSTFPGSTGGFLPFGRRQPVPVTVAQPAYNYGPGWNNNVGVNQGWGNGPTSYQQRSDLESVPPPYVGKEQDGVAPQGGGFAPPLGPPPAHISDTVGPSSVPGCA